MHKITSSEELSKLFMLAAPITLRRDNQFVLILRDGDRALVWKNVGGTLSADCFPNEAAWPEGVAAVNGLTLLVEENGRGDNIIRTHRLILRLELPGATEQVWLIGDDKVPEVRQVFLAYENPLMERIETVVIVEGQEKKPRSCGALSFNKDTKKALSTYVRVVKALMGLSAVSLVPMIECDIPPQIPSGADGTAGEREESYV